MNVDLTKLAGVLVEEIAVGEELSRNLAAQRRALVAWDIVSLLLGIEARERWLRLLTQLEQKRIAVLQQNAPYGAPATLRELITQLPPDHPERDRWRDLRERGRALFTRIYAEERELNALMENLVAHIQEALRSFTSPAVPLYRETGAADAPRPSAALLQRQA